MQRRRGATESKRARTSRFRPCPSPSPSQSPTLMDETCVLQLVKRGDRIGMRYVVLKLSEAKRRRHSESTVALGAGGPRHSVSLWNLESSASNSRSTHPCIHRTLSQEMSAD